MLSPDDQMIELLYFHNHPGKRMDKNINDVGLTHMAFTVNDLDQVYDRLRTMGLKFISEPKNSPDGYARVAFCQTPEGTYLELVELR